MNDMITTAPDSLVLGIILGMACVTYLPRVLPVWLLSSRDLPPVVTRWLSFVPASILSALLAPALLVRDGSIAFNAHNLELLAAIPTFLVAWRTKSFFGTVAAGMACVALARYIGL